jgi:hypothetical protein
MKFLRSVAGYTSKDQIINKIIKEELNISNLNNKILKYGLQWKHDVLQMKYRGI